MKVEEEMKILEEINKEIIIKGRLLYSYEIKEILDRFIVKYDYDNAPTVEPVKQCKYCKHCGNEDYCSNCHSDHSLFEYYERPQSDMLPVSTTFNIKPEDIKWNGGDQISRETIEKIIVGMLEKWADGYSYIEIPTDDAIREMKSAIDNAKPVAVNCKDCDGYEAGYSAGLKDAERPQAEWVIVKDKKYGDNVKCPFCGKELAGTDLNFCCKCGAKMKGGAE